MFYLLFSNVVRLHTKSCTSALQKLYICTSNEILMYTKRTTFSKTKEIISIL